MQRSKHRSWFKCPCGHTFRSVTHRKRGMRKCPACQLIADHPTVVPPGTPVPGSLDYQQANERVMVAALAVAHAARIAAGYHWALRIALDELLTAEEKYRQTPYVHHPSPIPMAMTSPPIKATPDTWQSSMKR